MLSYDIVKFGGTSVATADKIKNAARLISEHAKPGRKIIVIVSAMGKTTDELASLAKSAAEGMPDHHMDEILSMGERTSARVLTAAIASSGANADFIDIHDADWPIITDEAFGDANILLDETVKKTKELIARKMQDLNVLVMPGFIGRTKNGKITTIGRGGSDTTAFVIAGALNAKEVLFVSDVEGIMSADPKLIKAPEKIDVLEARKLTGLADSGAKFLHKKALMYKPGTADAKIISNMSKSLDAPGTIIKGSIADIEVSAISGSAAAITIVGNNLSASPGLLAEMLNIFKEENISIFGLSANHDSVVFYAPSGCIKDVYEKLHSIVIKNKQTVAIACRDGLAIVLLNGIGLQETPGSISAAATILRKAGINIFGQYTVMSEIFLLVASEDKDKALELLRKEFVKK